MPDLEAIAGRLIHAYDNASLLPPITAVDPDFDVRDAYEVLGIITARRRARGWAPVGRKIGFTNHTIWERYGVSGPMWAPMWAHTVRFGDAEVALDTLVQPRIEPEVVFKLRRPIRPTDDPLEVLAAVEWVAAGFEIVQSHYPDWRFTAADCTAAFGLHGALVVGAPMPVTPTNDALAAAVVTLSRDGVVVDRGVGSNVLGSPARALAHLTRVLGDQPQFLALAAGEIVTTGTITDAWPVEPGQTWTSDYGELGMSGLTVSFV